MSSYGYNQNDRRYSGGQGSGGFQQPGNYGGGRSMSRDGRAMSAQEEADAEELRLRREFEELDIDGNGIVDKNEMNEFLRQRNIDEEHRMQIIDVIFQNTDADNNNVISLDEFVQHYVNTKNQLVSKEVQLISDIVEKNREIKDSKVQLQISLSRNRGKVSQYAGQLSVKVVRAEGLTGIRRSHVVITQGNSRAMTKPQDGPAPNYDNNTLIEFDVGDEGAPILVSIVDSDRDISIMDTQIDLQDVQDASFPKGEFWLNARENDPSAPKLRIQVSYKTNSIYRHQMHIENLEEDMRNDVATLQQVRAFIVQLRNPFGFLKYDIDQANFQLAKLDEEEQNEEIKGDHQYFDKEKKLEAQFDQVAATLNNRYNDGQPIQWLAMTEACLWVFFVLNILVMIKKPAFLSTTAIVVGFYLLHNTLTIKRSQWRGLVLLLAVSWIYDFTWFFLLDQSAADEDLEDGGNEWKIRRFVKLVTFITILFKIIVVALFWKVSLEFRAIVRNKGQGSAQEDDIDFIVSQYQGAEQFIQQV